MVLFTQVNRIHRQYMATYPPLVCGLTHTFAH